MACLRQKLTKAWSIYYLHFFLEQPQPDISVEPRPMVAPEYLLDTVLSIILKKVTGKTTSK